MVDSDSQTTVEVPEDVAEPEWDRFVGVVTDGIVGAVGGLVGCAVMTAVLLVGTTVGVFETASFASLADTIGADSFLSADPVAVGYGLFLVTGMVTWPLLFASIGSYLPGETFAIKGLSFGFVLWTGFVLMFYENYTGLALAGYVVVTLVAHFAYAFSLGAVFDYLSKRPETLV